MQANDNAARRERTRANLERKVLIIERWLGDQPDPHSQQDLPCPAPDWNVPKTLEAFRVWSDEAFGVEVVGSSSTLNEKQSPHFETLIRRINRVIARAKKSTKRTAMRTESASAKAERLQEEKRELLARCSGIATAYHQISSELELLRKDHSALQRRFDNLSKAHVKIQSKGSNVVPLRNTRKKDF